METRTGPAPQGHLLATRPTREGWTTLHGGATALAVGLATGSTAAYLVASCLLGLYASAHLGAVLAARSLRLRWTCPDRVTALDPFAVEVEIENGARGAVAGLSATLRSTPVARAPIPPVPGRGFATATLRGFVRRRGRQIVPGPLVRLSWPLGLVERILEVPGRREVLAYPRRVAVGPADARAPRREVAPAAAAASATRAGLEFRGLREWSPGDPARGVAWRATARHGRLLVREFEREDAGLTVVLLDADPRALSPGRRQREAAVDRAVERTAGILRRLRSEGRRSVLVTYGPGPVVVPAASGAGHARALEALALLVPPGGGPRLDPATLLPPALRRAPVVRVSLRAEAP